MTNHEKIKEYINLNPNGLGEEFSYSSIKDIANAILGCTTSGKEYASLKFLQTYCTPVNVSKSSASDFLKGDPRSFNEIGKVKSVWKFAMASDVVIDKAVSKSDSTDDLQLIATSSRKTVANYYSFAIFLTKELSKHDEAPYKWNFSIRDKVDWLNDALLKGNTLNESTKVLTIAGAILNYSLNNNDERLCFEAVRLIMDWGGVYYQQGVRRGNQQAIESLYKSNTLLEAIACDYQRLIREQPENISLMNSGWTKAWSVLFPEKYIMFDSRVSFAFTKLLDQFCQNEVKKNGFYIFPSELGYRQIKQGNRNVEGFHSVNGNPKYWAKSMIVTSHILNSCLSYADVRNVNISRYEPRSLRSVEARLFMMGA